MAFALVSKMMVDCVHIFGIYVLFRNLPFEGSPGVSPSISPCLIYASMRFAGFVTVLAMACRALNSIVVDPKLATSIRNDFFTGDISDPWCDEAQLFVNYFGSRSTNIRPSSFVVASTLVCVSGYNVICFVAWICFEGRSLPFVILGSSSSRRDTSDYRSNVLRTMGTVDPLSI